MLVSEEELAWALDTPIEFARDVLARIRARQRREEYIPPSPAQRLREVVARHLEATGWLRPGIPSNALLVKGGAAWEPFAEGGE